MLQINSENTLQSFHSPFSLGDLRACEALCYGVSYKFSISNTQYFLWEICFWSYLFSISAFDGFLALSVMCEIEVTFALSVCNSALEICMLFPDQILCKQNISPLFLIPLDISLTLQCWWFYLLLVFLLPSVWVTREGVSNLLFQTTGHSPHGVDELSSSLQSLWTPPSIPFGYCKTQVLNYRVHDHRSSGPANC